MTMVDEVKFNGETYAMIIRSNFKKDGISFFTPNDYSQQLAYMKHPSGKQIVPHFHNEVKREVNITQEVLVIKSGRLRVDFYDEGQCYLASDILAEGDVILLARGGHGFEILDEVEMWEIKQGPFVGEIDKTRFEAPKGAEIVYRNEPERSVA